ncbi:hypothetical protein [Ammoniphilus oxalaticus]|uniref:hypothetical protein n=1 Tax=Ammoniphilus oxalaticus TaxID=66863 RepID=UPI001473D9D0|nr:hypothetical protein [Ammoniphilus oxalaticus]
MGEFAKAWGYIPPIGIIFAAIGSSVIPLGIYFINQWLHKIGDPPWKTSEEQDEREK